MSRAKAVAQRELDRHDTAETVHEGDEICEVVGADQAEVAWVLGIEEVGLLVLGWSLSAGRVLGNWIESGTHWAAVQLLWLPSRRHWGLQISSTCLRWL